MDITKEKERRIGKRNCYITLLQKSISNAKERLGEGRRGTLASHQSTIRFLRPPFLSHYLPKIFIAPSGGGKDRVPDVISFSRGGRRLEGAEKPAWPACWGSWKSHRGENSWKARFEGAGLYSKQPERSAYADLKFKGSLTHRVSSKPTLATS